MHERKNGASDWSRARRCELLAFHWPVPFVTRCSLLGTVPRLYKAAQEYSLPVQSTVDTRTVWHCTLNRYPLYYWTWCVLYYKLCLNFALIRTILYMNFEVCVYYHFKLFVYSTWNFYAQKNEPRVIYPQLPLKVPGIALGVECILPFSNQTGCTNVYKSNK